MIDVLEELLHVETLPVLKRGRRAHYEGSIDKEGYNADWDWHLYEDEKHEWVLFEQYGPGCLLNFIQHRYTESPEPTFRFYFDGEAEPRFTIKPSEFGEKYPFIEPLAGKYIGPEVPHAIRVVRSFVPMPFTSYCKVTSDLYLTGNSYPDGGWGHIVYHTYSEDKPKESFNRTDERYLLLARLWSQCGKNPLKTERKEKEFSSFTLCGKTQKTVFSDKTGGTLCGFRFITKDYGRDDLLSLWVSVSFDGEKRLSLPFGCLFSNEVGYHSVSHLFSGMNSEGEYYCYFPMPYGFSAEVTVENRGERTVVFPLVEIDCTREYNDFYKENDFGYFCNSSYYPKAHTKGSDSIIGELSGKHGHIVNSVISAYPYEENQGASCEGDVRVHFDGLRTPQIESDGSESYSGYGWGFYFPPQSNPLSGYDGKRIAYHDNWSMVRHLAADYYPFYDGCRFGIESGESNHQDLYHSGAIFYYGKDGSSLYSIEEFSFGETEKTAYFEGDDDDIEVTFKGEYGKPMEITADVASFDTLLLRRVSDQSKGRQTADVFVDGEKLEVPWYNPDSNAIKQWLEDEYVLPSVYVKNKKKITLKIVPKPIDGKTFFNCFSLKLFGIKF